MYLFCGVFFVHGHKNETWLTHNLTLASSNSQFPLSNWPWTKEKLEAAWTQKENILIAQTEQQ